MDYLEGIPSKEGAFTRTGSRTPMQWDEGKNHGFSESDTPYLPTDGRPEAPTVAAQEADPDSVLNFTKRLIRLHRDTAALHADGAFDVIAAGYPFVYTRAAEGKTLYVAINPSDTAYRLTPPLFKTVLLSQNTVVGDGMHMNGVSFIVAELA